MTVREVVIDANVVVKWYLKEQDEDAARSILQTGLDGNAALIAPNLLAAELGNVLWQRTRRGELLADEVMEVWATFGEAPIELMDISPLMPLALDISLQTGCAVYDALYVALAEARDTQVVTADGRLVRSLEGTSFGETVALL